MIDILSSKAIPIEQVALRLGHEVVGRKIHCISRDHDDDNASLSFDPRLNRFKCFACGLSGDVLDLVQITMGLTIQDAYSWLMGDAALASVAPVPHREYRRVPRLANPRQLQAFYDLCDPSGDWLAHKGISAGRFGVRLVTEAAHNLMPNFPVGGLFIPYFQHGQITYGRWRNTTAFGPKYLALPDTDIIIYNQDSLGSLDGVKPLYLTEGETDTMTLASMGRVAVGFPGATQYQLIERLTGWIEALQGKIPKIVLSFDDDEAGQRLAGKCREALEGCEVPISTFELYGHNDVNDWYNHEYL